MRSAGAEVRVLGELQQTSDMPDLAHHRGKIWDKKTGQTIDERARGLAGISCLCAEENLLKLPSDRHADHRASEYYSLRISIETAAFQYCFLLKTRPFQ